VDFDPRGPKIRSVLGPLRGWSRVTAIVSPWNATTLGFLLSAPLFRFPGSRGFSARRPVGDTPRDPPPIFLAIRAFSDPGPPRPLPILFHRGLFVPVSAYKQHLGQTNLCRDNLVLPFVVLSFVDGSGFELLSSRVFLRFFHLTFARF